MVSHFEVGTKCWQPDEHEGWVQAEVTAKTVDGGKVTLELTLENGTTNYLAISEKDLEDENSPNLPPLCNPPILEANEDLTNLSYLNEPAVMHAIRMRYQQLSIYTYSGIVLIATNPFQRVDSLYSADIIQMYSGKRRGELEPHLFAIAEDAYRCMIRDNKNQTIVVSGESGAGKTVSAKFIMRYFATVEDVDKPRSRKSGRADSLSRTEEQILATNPIMEAFGNAKTTRNDNSSRFGKYIEILFDSNPDIVGAKIRTYLLERSRLVFQPATERNYHIFYQLCAGATDAEREALGLLPAEEFQYMNQGGDSVIANVDDSEEFQLTRNALTTIGIDGETQLKIFQVLAALLHIGNISITAGRTDSNLSSTEPSLVRACDLLGIDSFSFAKFITKKQIITRSEKIVTNLNYKQAIVVRDSVSKFIYSALFDWLVAIINQSLAPSGIEQAAKTFIGVLDIYGFEHFQKNSFEQFCINYANEKLQQEFNQHVFKLEQDEYVREQIEWTFIEFSDNQPCIDLIEARIGILSLLDEESRLPSGTDDSWIQKLYTNFDVEKHKTYFKKPRFGKTAFTVHHYAMDVTYDSEGFIEKNRDSVPDEHLEILMASKNDFLTEILKTSLDASKAETPQTAAKQAPGKRVGTASNRKPTLGGIFKSSLIELMNTINSTNVHYIRCIKPNEAKEAWKFEGPMVLNQLRACGVLETIRISCEGFPTRWTFEEFVSRYYMLVNSSYWEKPIQDMADAILSKAITQPNRYQLGKTKIFFRAGMLAYLENLRSQRLNECAVLLQKNLKKVYFRNKYLEVRRSVIASQAAIRGYLARRMVEKIRLSVAATKIQTAWRAYSARKSFLDTRRAIINAQSVLRGYLVRKSLLKGQQLRAAVTIQTTFRGYIARKSYKDYVRKVVIVQSLHRRRQARKELAALKAEARSINHFKEVSYRLENKVVELTQTLATRTQENKKLLLQIDQMEQQLSSWQQKHDELQGYVKELETEAGMVGDHMKHAQELETKLENMTENYSQAIAKLQNQELETEKIRSSLSTKSAELGEALEAAKKEREDSELSLNEEIQKLKDEIQRLVSRGPVNGYANGVNQTNGTANGMVSLQGGKPGRSLKRHSVNTPVKDAEAGLLTPRNFNPRPASLASAPTASPGFFAGEAEKDQFGTPANVDNEIEAILDRLEDIQLEVVRGLIQTLIIPHPSGQNPMTANELLFPAHIINLVTSEMWRLGFVKESELLLALAMQTIQEQVMSYEGEDIIMPGTFWLSNVHEMLSFVCLAELNIVENEQLTSMDPVEFQEYERLVGMVKHDLENLEFNIYHTWMKELKKMLYKTIIPAVIESQSLPGFVTNEGSRFLSKVLGTSGPSYTMDDLLNFLNRIYKAMKVYYLEEEVVRQVVMELLKLVGVTAFNDLLSRRNFLSWKRGLQISYNITRIEEWCKSNDVPEGTLKLEHLMQATKLLQLKKSTVNDIEIIYDICWTLTASQIQKLISQYQVADYEAPISSEILKVIAKKAITADQDVLLLEQVPLDDSGPFEIALPRQMTVLETYMPGWLQVPNLRRLTELTATNSRN
ncbi:P-loop containing nucleoside triphosphate hydrolase protein [Lipomyces kononenkoae]|uniref:P-loop containing nucleoside triphosphate hydrolase protein n=1 Tax=Lipomyces kononenkoae TaxID=34357 RepID=A0ACC3T5B5_LIPKO